MPGNPLLGALEIAFNRYLDFNPAAREDCAALAGKRIGLSIRELGLDLQFAPQAASVQILTGAEPPDCRIEAGIFDLGGLAVARLEGRPATVLPGSGLRIEGDTDTAQRFQRLLDGVDFDWEELLARAFGDVVGHRIGQGLRDAAGFGREQAGRFARQSVAELQREAGELVTAAELDGFVTAVDTLRDDAARLEARLLKLERQA